jgi:TATA-binding protein-associated factor
LIKNRRELGFLVLNYIFKKYKKSCIYISKIFIQEILKALNDEMKDVPKSVVCETFCLVLTLAYIDDKDLPTSPSVVNAVNSCQVLKSEFEDGKRFLFDFKNYKNFQIFIPKSLTQSTLILRDYQLEGIKWLNFLWKYELNGILCDDMGLGKTLQSLITISLQVLELFKCQLSPNEEDQDSTLLKLEQFAKSKDRIFKKTLQENMGVVVCPNNLIYHWHKECSSRINPLVLHPCIMNQHVLQHGSLSAFIKYNLNSNKDARLPNLLVIGYSSLIKNYEFFDVPLGFVVLDEAHMIKNEKTQLAKAMKSLKSKRKLGLTGTPIQNNILELWSIFDFVMPGYLGQKKDFRKEHRTLMNMNMMSLELNKMRLTTLQKRKLEYLHAKVLPFIMRREKKDVLKDLPPKIIQDQECIMSQAQRKFYELFEDKERPALEGDTGLEGISGQMTSELQKARETQQNSKQQILSTLNNLRKIVNHPFLLESNPLYSKLVKTLKKSIPKKNKVLPFYFGGKFKGLHTILNTLNYQEENIFSCKNNPNKIIIFSRFRDCCRMIVDYFACVFPFIRTLHLSNDLSLKERARLVETFRVDKTFKVIILTTRIGGLGLNLSSANIVVMFDHDFNPMNDLQAMDRAHRIGQKKCVNVYRLVTKGIFNFRFA